MLQNFYNEIKHGVPSDNYTYGINDTDVLKIAFKTEKQQGATIDGLLTIAYLRLNEQNKKHPSRKTSLALTKIEEAIMWLAAEEAEKKAQ